MKKTVIGLVLIAIVIFGVYYYLNVQQVKITEEFKIKMESYGVKSEQVEIDTFSDKVVMTNFSYQKEIDKVSIVITANKLELVDFEISPAHSQEITIKEVEAENLDLEVLVQDGLQSKINIEQLNTSSLVLNQENLLNSLNTIKTDFITTFIKTPHKGLEILGSTINYKENNASLPIVTRIDRFYMPTTEDFNKLNIEYEKIKVEDENADISINHVAINELNIDLINELIINDGTENLYKTMIKNLDKLKNLPLNEAVFSLISFNDVEMIIHHNRLEQIKNKAITIDNIKLEIENLENLSVFSNIKNLKFNSEYLLVFNQGAHSLFGDNLPEQILFNYSSKNIANIDEKTIKNDIEISLPAFFESKFNNESVYNCENAWDALLMTSVGQSCIGLENFDLFYKDDGIIPIFAKLISTSLNIEIASIVPTAKKSVDNFLEMIKTGNAKNDSAIAEIINSFILLIEKPGELELEMTFDPPIFRHLLNEFPENFEYKVNVKQGDKNLVDLAS